MKKSAAYLAMGVIVAVLLGADYFLLTSSEALSRLAGDKLEEELGEVLTWERIVASMDGRVTLEGVAAKKAPLEADRVEISMAGGLGGAVETVAFDGLRFTLDDAFLEELEKAEPSEKTIRDLIPDPSVLPKIVCRSGELRVGLSAVFAEGAAQTFDLTGLVAGPVDGYRIHVEGKLEHPVLGAWRAEGEVDLDTGEHDIRCANEGWTIRPEIRDLLSPERARIYDKYLPGGLCDVRVFVEKRGEEPSRFRVNWKPRDMTLTYKYFPYRADRMRGEVDFFADGFEIKTMAARHGPASIRFTGAAKGYDREAAFFFRLEVDDADLDGDLRAALDEGGRGVWDLLEPSGRVSVRGTVERKAGAVEEDRIPLEIAFEETSLRYKGFPYPLQNVTGRVFVDGNDVVVRRILSRDGDATLDVSGAINDITGDPEVSLDIDARNLPLDGRLRAALPPEPRKTWDRFSPGGPVDLRWSVRKEKGKEPVHHGLARALGNRARFLDFPLPVTELKGEVELAPGRTWLRHLSGKAHGAHVDLHGSVSGGVISLDEIDVVGLKLDETLKKTLPENLRKLIRQLRLSGVVSFTSSLTLRDEGENDFTLNLNLSQGAVETDPRFEDLEGNVTLTGSFGKEILLMGPVTFSRLKVWDKHVTDVSASLRVRGPWVTFGNIKATAYGGVISGNLSVNTDTGQFHGSKLKIDHLDIRDYSRDTKDFTDKVHSGRASLDLPELTGSTGDGATVKGRGRLTIQDAGIWDVPLFGSLYSLNFQDLFKEKNAFDAGAIVFKVEDRGFTIESLAFRSESINVVGRGRIGFDGSLNLILRPKAERFLGIDFFLLKWITEPLGWLKDAFHGVKVTGTFDKPVVGQEFFPAEAAPKK